MLNMLWAVTEKAGNAMGKWRRDTQLCLRDSQAVEKKHPEGKGKTGIPQKEYIPHYAVKSKSRHSRDMAIDFKVLGMYLLSLSKWFGTFQIEPQLVCPGTPEFQELGLLLLYICFVHRHMEIFYLFVILMQWFITVVEGDHEFWGF